MTLDLPMDPTLDSVRIVEADLTTAAHQDAFLSLFDEYAREPIIHGKPISTVVKNRLLDELPHRPSTFVLLAFDGEASVGFAVCHWGYSTFAARPLINIHDLGVTARRRGSGVGGRIIAEVERIARESNCCKVTLEVSEKNRSARSLYRRCGFVGEQNDVTFFATKKLG